MPGNDHNIGPTCRVIRAQSKFLGKQGHMCAPAISAESVGAQRIHLQIVRIPPGGSAKAHKHQEHETAVCILTGESGMWYGTKLDQHLIARAGDFIYIPANMPHQPYNSSEVESCVALVARTDPNEQDSIVLLPEFERHHSRSAQRGLTIAPLFNPYLRMADLQSTVCSSKRGAIPRTPRFTGGVVATRSLPMQKITMSIFAVTLGAALLVSLLAP